MRVAAVEYLNTLPMIYGIRCAAQCVRHDEVSYALYSDLSNGLTLDIPSQCAAIAREGQCDIALVPVGALGDLKSGYTIITDYCISATGAVDTVEMFSNSELGDIKRIYRDSHSRTSVKLCEVLCREHWGIAPEYIEGLPSDFVLQEGEALVAIGDKVFDIENKFAHKWDMSEEWHSLYSLPFVFAVWVAISPEGLAAAGALNKALKYGVEHIEEALPDDPLRPKRLHYLTERIEFSLSEAKLQSMELFLSKI